MYFDHKINRPSATLTSVCAFFVFVVVVCDFFTVRSWQRISSPAAPPKVLVIFRMLLHSGLSFIVVSHNQTDTHNKKTSWNKCLNNHAISLEAKQTLIVAFKSTLTVFFGQGCNCVLLQDFCWYLWYSPLKKRMNEEKYWSNHKHEWRKDEGVTKYSWEIRWNGWEELGLVLLELIALRSGVWFADES